MIGAGQSGYDQELENNLAIFQTVANLLSTDLDNLPLFLDATDCSKLESIFKLRLLQLAISKDNSCAFILLWGKFVPVDRVVVFECMVYAMIKESSQALQFLLYKYDQNKKIRDDLIVFFQCCNNFEHKKSALLMINKCFGPDYQSIYPNEIFQSNDANRKSWLAKKLDQSPYIMHMLERNENSDSSSEPLLWLQHASVQEVGETDQESQENQTTSAAENSKNKNRNRNKS